MANGAEFTPSAHYKQADHDAFRAALAEGARKNTERLRELERAAFIREWVMALAKGGTVANDTFTVPAGGKLFDAIYPPPV